MSPVLENLAAVREAVEHATALFTDPGPPSLDRGSEELERAICQLTAVRRGLECGGPDTRAAMAREGERLRIAVHHAGRLLQGAGNFFDGWNRRLGELISGYTAHGDAAPVLRASHVSLHG